MGKGKLVGGVTMTYPPTRKNQTVAVQFTGEARHLFKKTQITFNPISLKVGFPTLDCRKFYCVRDSRFTFTSDRYTDEDIYVGHYDLFRIDEDNYQLKRKSA